MTDDAVARLKAEAETWAADIRAGAVREMTGVSGWPERQMARAALLDSLLAALAKATQRERALTEALTWALNSLDDGLEMPEHDCWFISRPNVGYCEFHEQYFSARALLAPSGTEADRG